MSSAAPSIAWLDGRIVPISEARLPIEDRGLQFGESLYEVIAVTMHRARWLAEHAERLRAGAELLGIAQGLPSDWAPIVRELQDVEQLDEGLLIVQLTGGAAPRSHLPKTPPAPSFFAYLRAYRFPREAEVETGIAAITTPDVRWAHCHLKTTMLLPAVMAKRAAAEQGASEAIFVSDTGLVHEGASSNVFAVEGQTIVTPRQSEHLLPGITRPIVARLARAEGLSVKDEELPIARLLAASEVFVTSTTFGVMPVVSIDGTAIGGARSGPVAITLARALRTELEI